MNNYCQNIYSQNHVTSYFDGAGTEYISDVTEKEE